MNPRRFDPVESGVMFEPFSMVKSPSTIIVPTPEYTTLELRVRSLLEPVRQIFPSGYFEISAAVFPKRIVVAPAVGVCRPQVPPTAVVDKSNSGASPLRVLIFAAFLANSALFHFACAFELRG